jgi:hypothetical protein
VGQDRYVWFCKVSQPSPADSPGRLRLALKGHVTPLPKKNRQNLKLRMIRLPLGRPGRRLLHTSIPIMTSYHSRRGPGSPHLPVPLVRPDDVTPPCRFWTKTQVRPQPRTQRARALGEGTSSCRILCGRHPASQTYIPTTSCAAGPVQAPALF